MAERSGTDRDHTGGDGGETPPTLVGNAAIVERYDRYAAAYDRLVGPLKGGSRERALGLLGASYGDRVLELGCGPGRGLVALADRVGSSGAVVGLDAAPAMLRRSARRVARRGANDRVSIVLGDARSPPISDNAVDAVLVEDTLELFGPADRRTVLAGVDRVLGRHGRLAVVTMARDEGDSDFVQAYDWAFENVPGLAQFGCRPIRAQAALEATGFEVVASETYRRAGVWPVTILIAGRS